MLQAAQIIAADFAPWKAVNIVAPEGMSFRDFFG